MNQELLQLIKELCKIPSFSNHEQEKAKYIQKWFAQHGIYAYIDEVNNVIVKVQINNDPYLVLCAHIDTVFPDEIGFECIEKDGYLYAPGVGDDTANVAELMLITREVVLNNLCNRNCLFVFNSCEEGLGNLRGSKYLFEQYSINEFYSFDLGYDEIICKAVGSIRYKINIQTEGGHSYSDFGNRNAIALASEIITKLYEYQVPTRGKSTYNVGIIEGGTSVNTIAQNASFLYEIRSNHRDDLLEMKQYFEQVISDYDVCVEIIGERPCMGDVNEQQMKSIVQDVVSLIEKHTGKTPKISSGSTDCNTSYAHGVVGCCFGGYLGSGEHTKEERIEIASLDVGMKILTEFVINKAKALE